MRKIIKIFPILMVFLFLAGLANASNFATSLIDHSESLNGSGWYNDPEDILGKPSLWSPVWGSSDLDHLSIVEPAWGDGYITTFDEGDWAIVNFDAPVYDDPKNPWGLDFIVYGNTMFWGSGYVYDTTDHTSYTLTGAVNEEPVVISVSQNGSDWYTFNTVYGDTLFPTNPWVWDPDLYVSTGNGWTSSENDYTLPVNPNLTLDDFDDISSYEAMLLYAGSAGGTGFDLADISAYYGIDLDWIQYIKVEGTSSYSGGEIDAFADVAPVPIPGAVWLFGSALLGLLGLRRKMARK